MFLSQGPLFTPLYLMLPMFLLIVQLGSRLLLKPRFQSLVFCLEFLYFTTIVSMNESKCVNPSLKRLEHSHTILSSSCLAALCEPLRGSDVVCSSYSAGDLLVLTSYPHGTINAVSLHQRSTRERATRLQKSYLPNIHGIIAYSFERSKEGLDPWREVILENRPLMI